MTYATKAAAELEKIGIDVELIDLRTLRPMDLPTVIESVKKTGRPRRPISTSAAPRSGSRARKSTAWT
jgi:pyruvate/2-oxoglutarate/acetoin dehydrogenase E1 component